MLIDFEPKVALMVAVLSVETSLVAIWNVALVCPGDRITDPGVWARLPGLELNVMTAPESPAGPFKLTVPMEVPPPVTLEGFSVRDTSSNGLTVRTADLVVPPYDAVIVALLETETLDVVIENRALVVPPGTVTLGGGCAYALFDERFTTVPLGGAIPLSVTVA